MRLALEDAGEVIFRLYDRIVKEAIGARDELAHAVGGDVIEEREHRIDHQDDGQHIVDGHHATEGEDAEDLRSVDDQAGEQQEDDGDGLQPVPEAAIGLVHVNRLGLHRTLGLFSCSDIPRVPCPATPISAPTNTNAPNQSIQ